MPFGRPWVSLSNNELCRRTPDISVAPRERAPLGAKTTNVRATAFQTPAPNIKDGKGQKAQQRSTSGRKPKLKIHQTVQPTAEPAAKQVEHAEVPDVEYCPPPAKGEFPPVSLLQYTKLTCLDLPDLPDDMDFRHKDFSVLEPGRLLRAMYNESYNPIGEDGMTRLERERKASRIRADAMIDERLRKQVEESMALTPELERILQDDDITKPDDVRKRTVASTATTRSAAPSTADSRRAVKALSAKPMPSFAAPTAATRARSAAIAAQLSPKPRRSPVGYAASRATVGYARGRRVSSGLKELNGGVLSHDVAAPGERVSRLENVFLLGTGHDGDGTAYDSLFDDDDDLFTDEGPKDDFTMQLPSLDGEE